MLRSFYFLLLCVALAGCQSAALKEVDYPQLQGLVAQGEQAYKSGNMDDAKRLFKEASRIDPALEQPLYRLGNIYFREKDLKQSAAYFSKVVLINPKNSRAHYNLGVIHLMFAEKHMKYFSATAPRQLDISKVNSLLGNLTEFSNGKASNAKSAGANSQSLDDLLKSIGRQ